MRSSFEFPYLSNFSRIKNYNPRKTDQNGITSFTPPGTTDFYKFNFPDEHVYYCIDALSCKNFY